MDPEVTLSTRRIYEGKILNLRVDRAALSDGHEVVREVVEFHGGVGIVALDDAGRVLLVRQYRYAIGRDLIELPAGKLEPGEPPEECAARELEEETGYRAAQMDLLCRFYSTPGGTTELLYLFVARGLTFHGLRLESDERIEVMHVPLDEAVAMIERGEILDAKTIIGLLRL